MSVNKLIGALGAAGAGGAALNVEDVFSIHMYDGTGSSQTITNNIDLDGEGGLVWIKNHDTFGKSHELVDTQRGKTKVLRTNTSAAEFTDTAYLSSFNSNGFTLGTATNVNQNNERYCSWTFRKAPRFFDIQTWTGDGASNRAIAHNIDGTVGMIWVRRRNSSENWAVWSKHMGADEVLYLDQATSKSTSASIFGTSVPNSSNFYVGNHPASNNSGDTYVAYIFADNNGDGNFGPNGDQDIIKCGTYTGNGTLGRKIDIGFEAQYVLVKNINSGDSWPIMDKMRGLPYKGNGGRLRTNNTDPSEEQLRIGHWSNGFSLLSTDSEVNVNGSTYIYIAIRNNMPAEPESGTEVYTIDGEGGDGVTPTYDSPNFTPDLAWKKPTNNGTNWMCHDRIRRGYAIKLNAGQAQSTSEDTEGDGSAYGRHWDYMDGWAEHGAVGNNIMAHMFKRAKGFLDIVRYTGAGTSIPINHQLGAVPKMVWCKRLDAASSWQVYHEHMDATAPEDYWMYLDGAATKQDSSLRWNDTAPTDTTFTVGTAGTGNTNNADYIAYVWGEVSGVSKFGTYTGNGTSQNIDCGFSSGARFVLIKALNVGYAWCVFTTHRGIVSGDDKFMTLETTAEVTNKDIIDPYASGFAVSGTDYLTNANNEDYIYWAIA